MIDVAESLTRRGVRYAVTGAMAAAVHGVVRASLDADAVVALKAFAGGPVDLADARAVIDLDRESLNLELLRRLAQRFGRETVTAVELLIDAVN